MTVTSISQANNIIESNTLSKTVSHNWGHHRVQICSGAIFITLSLAGIAAVTLLTGMTAWIVVAISIGGLIQGMLITGSGLFQELPVTPIPISIQLSISVEEKEKPTIVKLNAKPNYLEETFKKLTGKEFVENLHDPLATPEMEYLVHSIFLAIAEKDMKLLKFLLWDLEDEAPDNLYSVAKVGILIARAYRNTEALGLLREYRDQSKVSPFISTKK